MKEMRFARTYDKKKLYFVDTDDFGYAHEDIEEWENGMSISDEIDGNFNQPVLCYHDGNNWKLEFLLYAPEKIEFEYAEDQPEDPDPAYYEISRIVIDGEEIEIVTSNISGSITPYWEEENQHV